MIKFETTEVPAGLEAYYEEVDGTFRLKVEGAVPSTEYEKTKNSVKEFRDNNIALKKQVAELARFEQMFQSGDFSSEKLNKKIEDQALLKAAEMKTAYEAQIAELTTKLTGTSTSLEKIVRDNAVTKAAISHGVSETALEDVYARARSAFTVVDGQLAPVNGILDAKLKPLTVDAWMASLSETAPHLFNASRGAGASKTTRPIQQPSSMTPVDKISAGLAKRR